MSGQLDIKWLARHTYDQWCDDGLSPEQIELYAEELRYHALTEQEDAKEAATHGQGE